MQVVAPVVVHVPPAGLEVTVYPVMAEPPVGGAVQELLGVRIDGMVVVNLAGFVGLVDQIGGLCIGKTSKIAPDINVAAQSLGHGIGNRNAGIGKDLEILMVVIGQQRQQKPPDHMVGEIGRNIADLQSAVGVAVVGVGTNELPQ